MSVFMFYSYFKVIIQMLLMQYVKFMWLYQVCLLMVCQDMMVEVVGYVVGYVSVLQFNWEFWWLFGLLLVVEVWCMWESFFVLLVYVNVVYVLLYQVGW